MAAAIPNGYMPTYKPTTAVPAPISASQVAANATAFKQANWYNGGTTATPSTGDQNIAAAYNAGVDPKSNNIPTPYIQGVLGRAASDTAAQNAAKTPTTVNMPVSGGTAAPSGGNAAPKFDAAGIAASRVAAQRAALAGSVNAYDASRKQSYDYTTKNTQDQRVLDGAMFHEQNDPFSGKYAYDKTNILRNNNIQDTQNQMAYSNDIAASDAKLAAFDAGAPGLTTDIQNQLEQANQASTLALNQDNRAQQTQDHNFAQDDITNNRNAATDTYNQGQDTIKNNQSDRTYNLDYQKQMADLTGFISDGKGGYVPTSAQQKQDLTDAWTATTNLGSVTPVLSKLTGIPVGTPTEKAKTDAIQNRISQQTANNGTISANASSKNADTAATNSTNSQNNANADNTRADGAAAAKTYQDTFSNLQSLYTAKDPNTGAIAVTNPQQLRAAILAKNFDDQTTIKMLTDFGLPIHP